MKNINFKRLLLFLVIVIIVIVVIVKGINKQENTETEGDTTIDNTQQNVDSSSNVENTAQNSTETTTNNNTTVVPQSETTSVNEYVDDSGEQLDEETLKSSKETIIQAFKQIPKDMLGLDVDLDSARIIFNQGTTTIAQKQCLVFSVYVEENNSLKNVGIYAMSRDTKVVYKYNSTSLEYELIQ